MDCASNIKEKSCYGQLTFAGFIMKGGVVPPGIPYLLTLNLVGTKCAYFGPTFGAP